MIPRLILVPLAAAAAAIGAFAAEPAPLSVISAADGSSQQFHIADVDKITFEGANMVVAHSGGTATIPLGDIEKLCFDLEYDGIAPVAADLGEGLRVAITDGILTATAADTDAPLSLMAVDTAGMVRLMLNASGSLEADLRPLGPGMFIIKVNEKTIKFLNR